MQFKMSASEAATAASGSSSASSGWTLWVGKPVKTRDSTGAVKYDHGQVEVRSGIATVKQLAAVLGAVQSPTELIEKRKLEGGEDPYSLFLFRDGLIPRWEEPSVKKGGRWMVTYKREDKSRSSFGTAKLHPRLVESSGESERIADLDDVWRDVCIAAISGDVLGGKACASDVAGVALERRVEKTEKKDGIASKRSHSYNVLYRIAVWTKTRSDEATQKRVAQGTRVALKLPAGCLGYMSFAKEERKSGPVLVV